MTTLDHRSRTRAVQPGPGKTAGTIADAIRDGRYSPHQLLPSYARLAASHGVGIRTIRTAMTILEKQGLVTRRERLGVFVRELPRRSQHTATALRCVTVINTGGGPRDGFPVSEHLAAHSRAADRHDLRMRYLTCPAELEGWFERDLISTFRAEELGCIIAGAPNDALLRGLAHRRIPYVVQCYARYNREHLPEHAGVFTNKYAGAFEATEYLLGLGHRRIGFVGNADRDHSPYPGLRVYEGYRAALHRAGLESRRDDVAHVSTQDPLAAVGPATTVLDKPSRPTAILSGNDAAAMGVVKAALVLGIAVPEQLSVIGFDNVPWMDEADIPLTTVSVPRQLLAETAFELLLDTAAGRTGAHEIHTLETDLVIRDTTAPPAQAATA